MNNAYKREKTKLKPKNWNIQVIVMEYGTEYYMESQPKGRKEDGWHATVLKVPQVRQVLDGFPFRPLPL